MVAAVGKPGNVALEGKLSGLEDSDVQTEDFRVKRLVRSLGGRDRGIAQRRNC